MPSALAEPRTAREPGRPRWWVAGLAAFLVLAVGVLAVLVLGDDEYVANPGRPGAAAPTAAGPAEVEALLAELERAVSSADVAAAEALAAPSAAESVGGVARNAADLRVRDFTLRYVDQVAATADEVRAAVDVTWRFAGFDAEPAQTEVEVRLTRSGDELRVVEIGGGDLRSPVWLTGPVDVRRAPGVLVLGDISGGVDSILEHASRAVPVVRRVLPAWRSGLVVEVPGSAADLGRALGAEQGEYGGVAAVTASPDGSLGPRAPLHVFVNPEVLGTLEPRGAQVVMSHEATHVATRAPSSTLPLWLLEGFADYVALRDVELPLSTTAGQVIGQVRDEGVPQALPGPAEFDTATTHLGAAYEAAWLACLVLVERGGEEALVDLYRSADRGDVEVALRRELGWSLGRLTEAWQERLRDLAS